MLFSCFIPCVRGLNQIYRQQYMHPKFKYSRNIYKSNRAKTQGQNAKWAATEGDSNASIRTSITKTRLFKYIENFTPET